MYYIIYVSSSAHLMSDSELKDILVKSYQKNNRLGITGMLLYSEGNIIQVLEGDEKKVTNLYNEIRKDFRHHNIVKVGEGVTVEHNFPDWTMGFESVFAKEFSKLEGYRNPDDDDYAVTSSALTLLRIFAENQSCQVAS